MTRTTLKSATFAATALALVLGLGVSAVDAHSRDGKDGRHGMPRHSFEEIDANADGKVTADELEAHARARFDAADTDGNGSLSATELTARADAERAERETARKARRSARMLERMDADDNGEISFDEMTGATRQSRMERMLSHLDTDGDQAISAEEFSAAADRMGEGRDGKGHHGRGHDDQRRTHGHDSE